MQKESRDELGIGLIRDALSELLFPGTSVLQTRARYFLFVPWLYLEGERLGHAGAALRRWVEQQERRLVETLKQAGEDHGLIGRRAGPAVKLLPSSIYWSGLRRYGILRVSAAVDELRPPRASREPALDEWDTRPATNWDPSMPTHPAGFPKEVDDGLQLRREEAEWLRERILVAAPDTLLAHLLLGDQPPDPDSVGPWDDPLARTAPPAAAQVLHHAHLFSLAIHGAALLYNLLLAERYEQAGYTEIAEPVPYYREELAAWAEHCDALAPQLGSWDREGFWALLRRENPRIGLAAQGFVDTWLAAVAAGQARQVADDSALRRLVAHRERTQKGQQSRLDNQRLLTNWSGASGSARLTFRWDTVWQLVTDIQEGRQPDARA